MAPRRDFERIIEAFECGDSVTAVSDVLADLHSSVHAQIITSIRSPPVGITSISLLRALWCSRPLRPRILTTFAAAAPREITGHETQLLDEFELLLAGDARDVTASEKVRLRSISHCASTVFKAATCNPSAHHVPLLLFCARACGQVGTQRGRDVRGRIVRGVLRLLQIPGNLGLASIAVLLEDDFLYSSADESLLLAAVDAFVVLTSKQPEQPALFRTLLTALGRAKTQQTVTVLGQLALHILHVAGQEILSELLMLLSVVHQETSYACSRLVSALTDLIRMQECDNELHCSGVRLGISHVSALYCMLGFSSSVSLRRRIGGLLEEIVENENVPLATSQVASSSADARDAGFVRRAILSKGMDVAPVRANGDAVFSFYEAQVWSGRRRKQAWGVRLLFEVFCFIPNARTKILTAISSALVDEKAPERVVYGFCGLLEELCSSNRSAFVLKGHTDRLQDILKYIEHVPLGFDTLVVTALINTGVSIPSMRENIFLLLQKLSGSRLSKLQRIAGVGLVTIIDHPGAVKEVKSDACNTLVKLLDFANFPVRSHITSILTQVVSKNPQGDSNCENIIDLLIHRTLTIAYGLESPSRLVSQKNGIGNPRRAISLDYNFKVVDGDCSLREDLSTLLRFCSVTQAHNPVAEMLLFEIVQFLSNTQIVISEACQKQDLLVSVQMRIEQLCSLYETVVCLGLEGLSFDHIQGYALSLLIREFMEGKEQKPGDIITKLKPGSSERFETAVFASTAARQSNANETMKIQSDSLISMSNCIKALHSVLRFDINNFYTQVVAVEAMSIAYASLIDTLRLERVSSTPHDEIDELLRLSRACFHSSRNWNSKGKSLDYREELESAADSDQTTKHSGHDSNSDELPTSSYEPQHSAASMKFESFATPAVHVECQDVTKALDAKRLKKQALTVPFSLRQLSLAIFVKILKADLVGDQWLSTSWFLGAIPNAEEDGPDQRRKRIRFGSMIGTTDSGKARNHVKVRPVHVFETLAAAFCNEFENSLSIALTQSYLDLFEHLLEIPNECPAEVRSIVESMVIRLLQDYSITHQRVLRSMLNLLMEAFDQTSGLRFATSVFRWLGNDSCLLNSLHSSREESKNSVIIGVDAFDLDILEEAIALDMAKGIDYDETRDRIDADIEPAHGDSSCTESAIGSISTNDHSCLNKTARRSTSRDPVRALCLNESADTGTISISCLLDYISSLVRAVSEACRQPLKQLIVDGRNHSTIADVVGALEELFGTAFAEMKTPRGSRMPPSLRRKIRNLLLTLTEIAISHIRALDTALIGEHSIPHYSWVAVVERLAKLLSDGNVCNLLEYVDEWDQGSKSAFLLEKLDATSVAFVSRPGTDTKSLIELRSTLQNRLNQRAKQKNHIHGLNNDDGLSGNTLGNRPSKKQRVRSRNRQVDEWLQQERGDDNFADLEDFVVPMDAADL